MIKFCLKELSTVVLLILYVSDVSVFARAPRCLETIFDNSLARAIRVFFYKLGKSLRGKKLFSDIQQLHLVYRETEQIKETYINGASAKLSKYKKETVAFRTVTAFKGTHGNAESLKLCNETRLPFHRTRLSFHFCEIFVKNRLEDMEKRKNPIKILAPARFPLTKLIMVRAEQNETEL